MPYIKPKPIPNTVIGLDPGVHFGYAVWDRKLKKFVCIETLKLYEVFDEIRKLHQEKHGDILVRIENPNTFIPFRRLSRKELDGRLQGAGNLKRSYSAIIEFLEDYNIEHVKIKIQKSLKKLSAKKFEELTGWSDRTSEHARDAGCLCWGL